MTWFGFSYNKWWSNGFYKYFIVHGFLTFSKKHAFGACFHTKVGRVMASLDLLSLKTYSNTLFYFLSWSRWYFRYSKYYLDSFQWKYVRHRYLMSYTILICVWVFEFNPIWGFSYTFSYWVLKGQGIPTEVQNNFVQCKLLWSACTDVKIDWLIDRCKLGNTGTNYSHKL